MPVSSTSTDYSTRKKDLHIFQGVNPAGVAAITPSFGAISNYCSGIQKLVQRYTILLLTAFGSQENFKTFGTDLIPRLFQTTNFINRADVFHIFNFANSKVLGELKAYQKTNSLPDDERIDTAVLKDVVTVVGQTSLNITIYPATGGAPVVFLLPLPIS